ncbi:hypothetical protein GTY65_06845 [Streptomyces sp. SID8379]|uniref:hypothetical protein n=1 Tax=unclassified Streptomyces TaxID=2593676 RepID=UPI00037978AA|nr:MULTISPECIES: hypothetical protein [unclassified Streptomyces]MYW63798.1 hypothetical protein [Streptomyces sp. SID8379]
MFCTRYAVLLGAVTLAWLPAPHATAGAQDPPALLTVAQCRSAGGAPAFRVYGGGDAYRCVKAAAGAGPAAGGTDPGFAYVRRPHFDLDYLAPAECQAGGGVLRWEDGAEAGGGSQVCRGGAYHGKTVVTDFGESS